MNYLLITSNPKLQKPVLIVDGNYRRPLNKLGQKEYFRVDITNEGIKEKRAYIVPQDAIIKKALLGKNPDVVEIKPNKVEGKIYDPNLNEISIQEAEKLLTKGPEMVLEALPVLSRAEKMVIQKKRQSELPDLIEAINKLVLSMSELVNVMKKK